MQNQAVSLNFRCLANGISFSVTTISINAIYVFLENDLHIAVQALSLISTLAQIAGAICHLIVECHKAHPHLIKIIATLFSLAGRLKLFSGHRVQMKSAVLMTIVIEMNLI